LSDPGPDIIEASRNGDEGAFRCLVESYQGYAYALAARALGDPEEAGDVVQEAFVRVWKHLHRYDKKKKFTTWLYSIVSRLCIDRLRRRRSMVELDPEWPASGDLFSQFCDRDLLSIIVRLTRGLPPLQRMVFTLRDLEDLEIDRVAEILGRTRRSVTANLWLARRSIRQRLQELEEK